MAITITGDLDALIQTIEQTGKRAVDHAARRMGAEAEKVAQLARDYAPVEHHGLEEAITVEGDKSGINGRKVYRIFVDENAPELNEDGSPTGRLVGRYAGYMHEGSDYKLGKLSREKAAALGVRVGPKFLERAADERADEIEKSVYNAARQAL